MTYTTFTTPAAERFFEDYLPGATYACGQVVVSAEDIIAFAARYDPQPFHVDPASAAQSMYGGLIASGWHTAALTMRQLVDHFVTTRAGLGSPGVDELRWHAPVRPNDELRMRATVQEARRSRSNPTRGVIVSLVEVINQHDVRVMSMKAVSLLLCGDGAAAVQS